MIDLVLTIGLPLIGIVMAAQGFIGRRHAKTIQQFFLMDGKLTLFPYVGSFAATNYSLGNVIFLALIWGAYFGLGGLFWLLLAFVLAAVVFSYALKHSPAYLNYFSDVSNTGTLHEFLYQRYHHSQTSPRPGEYSEIDPIAQSIRFRASAVTVTCLVMALTLELYLCAGVLAPLIRAEIFSVFVVMTVLICAYTSLGGFWSVVWTDVMQGTVLIFSIIVAALWIATHPLPIRPVSSVYSTDLLSALYAPKWSGILSICGVTVGWYLVTMDTWQRAAATRSGRKSGVGLWVGTGIVCLGLVAFALFGMYDLLAIAPALPAVVAKLHSGGLNPIADFYLLAPQLSKVGQLVVAIVCIGLVMAGLSTANTFLIVSAHSFVSDLIIGVRRHLSFGSLSDTDRAFFVSVARLTVIAMGALILAAYGLIHVLGLLANPLALFFVAYSIQYALLVPIVYAMKARPPHARAARASLTAGFVAALIWGFGFVVIGRLGFSGWRGVTVDELIYLTPLPAILFGFLAMKVAMFRSDRQASP